MWAILMTHVLRIAHLRIAHHVANTEVGKHEGHQGPRIAAPHGTSYGGGRDLVWRRFLLFLYKSFEVASYVYF